MKNFSIHYNIAIIFDKSTDIGNTYEHDFVNVNLNTTIFNDKNTIKMLEHEPEYSNSS